MSSSITIKEIQFRNQTCYITSDYYLEEEIFAKVISCPKFKNWFNSISENQSLILEEVHIFNVHMFGPHVGFINFSCKIKNTETNKTYSSIIFCRGDSIAVLVVLICNGRKYLLLTKQPRFAVAEFRCVEICAGMIDATDNSCKVRALTELKEETGIEVDLSKLIDLTEWAGIPNGFMMSPGGCDEKIKMYCVEHEVTLAEMAKLQNKKTGVETEDIILDVISCKDKNKFSDAKLHLAYNLYVQWSNSIKDKK
jgi:ADP-sugar diphosphatase